MKTRNVDRFHAKDYLKRATECKNSMGMAFDSGDYSASVINAIHCAISSVDAFCIFKNGLRNASERHQDSIALFLSIDSNSEEIKRNSIHLSRLLDIKTDAEYGERLSSKTDAENAKKHAERLFEFAKSRIT
ncbi:MAG: HEPN domain-containing protein [Candidatus Aenigmarchaeota archaeon]|nr:HEPN domain-containing protein [Candidatus Aenigmarchaeota archaeon]